MSASITSTASAWDTSLSTGRPGRSPAGEAQRVALTSALGSGLVRTLYVLDEPSVGLHPQDVGRLVSVVKDLRDVGNTVIVVEHDETIVRASDLVVEIGPGAGEAGGRIVAVGPPGTIERAEGSATAAFLSGQATVRVPARRRTPSPEWLRLTGSRGNNLKAIDVAFPLGVLCVVTGVSGSGKSTLVEETLYPALRRKLGKEAPPPLPFDDLTGWDRFDDVVLIDSTPIGRSGRSNPVTYLKAFDEIRKTFAATHEAKLAELRPGPVQLQCRGGPLQRLRGERLPDDRHAVPARRPDPLPRVPGARGFGPRRWRSPIAARTSPRCST